MKRFFSSIIDVRKGEVALTILMFLYYYLLLVTYYFLKPARDSLFLVKLGSEQLPIVYMLIAVIVVPVTTIYSKASRSLRLNRLINITTIILIVNLLLLRWLLNYSHPAVFYTFYIWVSIYGILTTAQFWLFVNGVFDALQAKRLFVLFGLGGIVGAFTGGEVTGFFVHSLHVSTENLLFFCVAFLIICVFLLNAAWSIKARAEMAPAAAPRRQPETKAKYGDIFRTIKASRHLILIVGIIAITMATGSFVDFQFKTISAQSFTTKQDLTTFLGKFYGRLSLVSFLFQLLLSYRVLRWVGVGGAILILPVGLLAGSSMLLVAPGLLAAILLQGAGGAFKYSIDKTGRELLFLPIPLEIKKRTKVFIDIFVDRWFRGFAGAVLFVLVSIVGLSVRQLSIVVLGMLGLWITLVFMMRKEYINTFRTALERREIDPSELRISVAEASTLRTLTEALGGNDRQVLYALEMLQGVEDSAVTAALKPLLHHDSTRVRLGATRLLRSLPDSSLLTDMKALLNDDDPEIRREAMFYRCRHAECANTEALRGYLSDPEPSIRAAAIGCIAEYGDAPSRELVDDSTIASILDSNGASSEPARAQLAEALGALDNPDFDHHLLRLLDDPSPSVVANALRSAGRTRRREFIAPVLERLHIRTHREAARDALRLFGDRIVGTLSDYVSDPSQNITIRSQLCRVMSRIPTQHSLDTLVSTLDRVEPEMKYHVIRALNSLRARHPDLVFSREALENALIDETESYYAILQIFRAHSRSKRADRSLLDQALCEKIDRNLESIFRLLALRYTQKDIHSAYLGIVGDEQQLKASAIEFLDNLLKKEVKRYLFPIVDNVSNEVRIKKGQELFGVNLEDHYDGLRYLIEGRDAWLRTCAIFGLRDVMPDELRESVERCLDDPNPVVRETAELVLASGVEKPPGPRFPSTDRSNRNP